MAESVEASRTLRKRAAAGLPLSAAIACGVATRHRNSYLFEQGGAASYSGPGIITPALCDALPLLSEDVWPELLRLLLSHWLDEASDSPAATAAGLSLATATTSDKLKGGRKGEPLPLFSVALATKEYGELPLELRAVALQQLCESALAQEEYGSEAAHKELIERREAKELKVREEREKKVRDEKEKAKADKKSVNGKDTKKRGRPMKLPSTAQLKVWLPDYVEKGSEEEVEDGDEEMKVEEVDEEAAKAAEAAAEKAEAAACKLLERRVRVTKVLGIDREGARYWVLPYWAEQPPPEAKPAAGYIGGAASSGPVKGGTMSNGVAAAAAAVPTEASQQLELVAAAVGAEPPQYRSLSAPTPPHAVPAAAVDDSPSQEAEPPPKPKMVLGHRLFVERKNGEWGMMRPSGLLPLRAALRRSDAKEDVDLLAKLCTMMEPGGDLDPRVPAAPFANPASAAATKAAAALAVNASESSAGLSRVVDAMVDLEGAMREQWCDDDPSRWDGAWARANTMCTKRAWEQRDEDDEDEEGDGNTGEKKMEVDGDAQRAATGMAVAETAEEWQAAVKSARTITALRPLLYGLHMACAEAIEASFSPPSQNSSVHGGDGLSGAVKRAREEAERAARKAMMPSVTAAMVSWSGGWVNRVEMSATASQMALRIAELSAASRRTDDLQAGTPVQVPCRDQEGMPTGQWKSAHVAAVYPDGSFSLRDGGLWASGGSGGGGGAMPCTWIDPNDAAAAAAAAAAADTPTKAAAAKPKVVYVGPFPPPTSADGKRMVGKEWKRPPPPAPPPRAARAAAETRGPRAAAQAAKKVLDGFADDDYEEGEEGGGLTQDSACVACKRSDGADEMLLCDGCDDGYHLGCLNPPLRRIPRGDWFCKRCERERRKRGREEAKWEEEEEDSDEEADPRRRGRAQRPTRAAAEPKWEGRLRGGRGGIEEEDSESEQSWE